MVDIKELDAVRLKDGRIGAIVDLPANCDFMLVDFEIEGQEDGYYQETLRKSDVAEVIYRPKD